ncbi:FecR family protein [Myxococcota bacterium]|nr:FecR family protein [Myxococcota bacterium]
MNDEAQIKALLRPLKAAPPQLDEARQAALWAQLQAKRAAPPISLRKTIYTRAAPRLALAAALALLGLWALRAPQPTAPSPAPPPITLTPEGAALETASALAGGARVEVSGRGRVLENAEGRVRLGLEAGSIYSDVPRLAPGGAYVVVTPTAEIRVHGTRFMVEHGEGVTEVRVEEGVVEVTPLDGRRARRLHAGERAAVYPSTDEGLEAAIKAAAWPEAVDIALRLPEALSPLAACNARLRLGLRLDERAPPSQMARLWDAAARRDPGCVHAEQLTFRAAAALRAAGDLEAARSAAAAYRRRFPQGHRVAETLAW